MYRHCSIFLIILIYFSTEINCQTEEGKTSTKDHDEYATEEYVGYDSDYLHCLRFTWLGPGYDNTSHVNGTDCNDLASEKKLKNTPCKQPLVVTHDGTPPNMTYLWENHQDNILCRKSRGESCIKYTYSFNNQLENVTYMCGKVIALNEGPVRSGCYSQWVNGYKVKVCVCEPRKSSYYPCFYSGADKMAAPVLFFVGSLFLFQNVVTRWWDIY